VARRGVKIVAPPVCRSPSAQTPEELVGDGSVDPKYLGGRAERRGHVPAGGELDQHPLAESGGSTKALNNHGEYWVGLCKVNVRNGEPAPVNRQGCKN
jgi:hypothetical protein